jgi:hypothetical protein
VQLDIALTDTYRYLQKYAVGIEQVVWDQMDSNGPFKNQFADIEFKLRAVSGIYILGTREKFLSWFAYL